MWIHGHQTSSQQVGATEVAKGTPADLAQEAQGSLCLPATLPPPRCLLMSPRWAKKLWSSLDWVKEL